LLHHPLHNTLPTLLVPLIRVIVRSLKKSRASAAPATTTIEQH
jgi:hypothetical protein